MIDQHNSDDALDQAADWIGRLRSDDVTAEDKQAFADWFSRNAGNRAAFDRLLSLWQDLVVLEAMHFDDLPRKQGTGRRSMRHAAPAWARGWQYLQANSLAFAAALAAVALLSTLLLLQTPGYETVVGEQASHRLADGSDLHLNTDTRVTVSFGKDERDLSLVRGEAFFEVAKDPLRPFVVHACSSTIVAVGTAFNVHCEDGNLAVTVTRGEVKVTSAKAEHLLTRSEQLQLGKATPAPVIRQVNPATVTAWRQQLHVYEGVPLRDVVTDLNRYSEQKIRVFDKSLGDIQVVARYRMTDRAATLKSLEKTFPLRVVHLSENELALVPRN